MVRNNIDRLPDDIISHIFSFLPLRDAFRARLSSRRWLHLTDSRSVLRFDSLNVFGNEINYFGNKDILTLQFEFVEIVNFFMKIWTRAGRRINTLVINFRLGNEHTSHVDSWIATCVTLNVRELQLCFPCIFHGKYGFPFYLAIDPCEAACVSWLRNINTLELSNVPLNKRGMDFIRCTGSNLISLRLSCCDLPCYLSIDNGQLPRLKTLAIHDELVEIKLNCPSLEVFESNGSSSSIIFVHVPLLREAKLLSTSQIESSSLFSHVTGQAPHLRVLSLLMKIEVKPLVSTLARCLKELKISIFLAFDLLTLTNMLNASPFLETLHIQLCMFVTNYTSVEKGEYCDCSHYYLKQVEIDNFLDIWNEMELATYLLKNAVALERMVIRGPRGDDSNVRNKVGSLRQLQKQINPDAQVILV